MITNIFLGLILGIVITSFIVLNNKLFNIIQILGKITDAEYEKVLKDNEHWVINEDHYNNIITLLKSRFKDLDNATDNIYDRFNTLDNDIENLIITEHKCTRNEIKKKAKISSKIKSQSKTNNNTNKQ